jgi:phenylpropionate dioxygenase-like ring-hydroxylating dioxygenase large terminal subunit
MSTTTLESPKKFMPLPRKLTASQLAAIAALPAHDEAPSPTTEASRPARIYTDPARFAAEQAAIFKKVPMAITPSCAFKEPGSFLANDHFGVPVLLSRDLDGKAHAFLNICRHRGAKLVPECEAIKSRRVTCGYHAWTYDLQGRLVGLPRAETFPSADKSKLGLIELPCMELGGFIWIGLDPKEELKVPAGAAEIDADLKALGIPEMHVYGQRYYDLKANWKLVIEPFLEPYHVKRLHIKTVADLNSDNHPIPVWLGQHLRQTAGRINFVPDSFELNSDLLHKSITHSYMLFPNTIIVTSPYFISTMALMPRAADRTIVQYSLLMPQKMEGERAEDLFRRSYEFQDEIFREDYGAALSQQEALSSGALETVHFGGMEASIGPFHNLVESYLPAEAI